ncbi:DMT family protein [Amycolatopsis aidingensis]|uniref:hypothetical protein n=1 Tax=Amycolatopsis aidingensis TaxID=2842453 RepID=UPI001C0C5B43|nr:hypothetical protein [Amycolatopsis aidingensis]
MTPLAIVLAVLGAGCNAVGAHLQHSGVRTTTGGGTLRLRALGTLARNHSWLRGVLVLAAGAVLQILALTFAPVSVVAPIVVLALPIIAVLNARSGRAGLDPVGWMSVLLTGAAVAVLVSVSGATVAETSLPPSVVVEAGRLVAAVVAALALVALLGHGILRCLAVATAAGAAYGLVVVLIRDVTFTARTEGLGALPVASLVGIVVAFLIGSWLVQLGYASGPADVVVGAHTVVNPLTATAIGLTLLGEASGVGGVTLAVLGACGAAAVAGVVLLARHHLDSARPDLLNPAS